MQKIYLDAFSLLATADTFEVVDDATYVAARSQLLAQVRLPHMKHQNILVQRKPWTQWFTDLPEQVECITPLGELRKLYPLVKLPSNLTDQDVLDLKLLKASIEPSEQAITKIYFNALLPSSSVKSEFLYFISRYIIEKSHIFKIRFLKHLWEQNLTHLPAILHPLRSGNVAFANILSEGLYLRNWLELLQDWQHKHAATLKKDFGSPIADLLPFLSSNSLADTFQFDASTLELQYELAIKKHTFKVLKSENSHFLTLPGRYKAELQAIIEFAPLLNANEKQLLENKYAKHLTANAALHKQLSSLVPPLLAQTPTLTGLTLPKQYVAWQQWATSSFIPYKFWLDQLKTRTEAQVEDVEKMAILYGDWLFDNYSALMGHDDILTNRAVRHRIAALLENPNNRVIWLIIDGLPAVYTSLLSSALQKHSFNRVQTDYALAPLPTITEIGIPALLTGLRPDAKAFTAKREEGLAQSFPKSKTVFTASVGYFAEKLAEESDLCCLHYVGIDSFQHKPESQITKSRAAVIEAEINEQIDGIIAAMQLTPGRNTKLVITTDHGATKCLRNASGIINSKIKAATLQSHERCVKLNSSLTPGQLDANETYHLTKDITHNTEEWIVARGYRYFGANDTGYRHGGLSPEETIVPIVVAEMVEFDYEELTIGYFGSKDLQLGKTIKDVSFQVYNPNAVTVEVRELTIHVDINAQFALPILIEANSRVVLDTILKLPRTLTPQKGFVALATTIAYLVHGEAITTQTSCSVPIQKANEADDLDFDAL
jgi:PglZ domain